MRRRTAIGIRVGCALVIILLVCLVYPAFKRPKARDGQSPRAVIRRQLEMIADAKELLKRQRDLPDGYWPTRTQIAIAYTGKTNASFNSTFKQTRWGEIYVVNQIGAPALVYLNNPVAGFSEGRLLTSEDLGREQGKAAQQTGARRATELTNPTSSAASSRR